MRGIIFIGVTLFWAVMTELLVMRQMTASASGSPYKEFIRSGLSEKEVVMASRRR